ncbi:Competence-damaged protein:CinA [Anaerovibrio sp. JC8]|uniref:CinA family protein n=1 Tax=Anaerovibrio sp. JC8 TaxID=1240085 RepID=UPI000A0EA5BB|nr:nicotinamide-nucleotide amidohydrolase family protein [Anaerovibrio sp. JC8]ORU01341.1 Competence-damaged protein:CinA [Anaerovibrio sp. JC8]
MEKTLEEQAGQALLDTHQTIACAESCTGGLLTSRLTDVAGSSAYVLGSIVSYTNEVKMSHLGVKEATLKEFGAVSEQTAKEMSSGIKGRIGADIGVGITGIAGPGGGSVEKPVGLVYISVAGPKGVVVTKNLFSGTRTEIKRQTTDKALTMLIEYIGKF